MKKEEALVIEQTYRVPARKIWKAITSREEMQQWYFNLPEFKPEVGFTFQFLSGPDENRQYLHVCTITEVVAGQKLAYSWQYDGYPGSTLVVFELFAEEEQTRLRLTHKGLETLPDDTPDFARANFEAGWNWIIGTALKEYAEKANVQ